jgi:hypothetical protein
VLLASAGALGLVLLYPTSTSAGTGHRRPGHIVAAPGIVTPTGTPGPGPQPVLVNGTPADTYYGPVQVELALVGGRITAATAIDYPTAGGRDRQINAYAIPVLQDETVTAQSDQVDTVSGATFTSDGYRRSLQSALDAAHAAPASPTSP